MSNPTTQDPVLAKILGTSVTAGDAETRKMLASVLKSGIPIEGACDALGLDADDVWAMVVRDADVRDALKAGETFRALRVQRELVDGTADALATIRRLMQENPNVSPETNLKAATEWLDRTKVAAKKTEKGGASVINNNLLIPMSTVDPDFMARLNMGRAVEIGVEEGDG